MAAESNVGWTDATWPIVQGCDYESPGCAHCYAVREVHRQACNPNPKVSLPVQGLVERKGGELRWTGKVACREDRLDWPLRWKKPRMIFVPSLGDLFEASVPDEFIDRVFAVMALCPQHTFQVLTKRVERMRDYLRMVQDDDKDLQRFVNASPDGLPCAAGAIEEVEWPFPNVWLGVSVEDQARADERIPLLLQTPAALRFLSIEPLLDAVDLLRVKWPNKGEHRVDVLRFGWSESGFVNHSDMHDWNRPLDWVIVGGESGPYARPCDLDWVRDLVQQCKAAGVACFVKQLGANPIDGAAMRAVPGAQRIYTSQEEASLPEALAVLDACLHAACVNLRDPKGGDPAEWPEDLRVREFPNAPV